MKARRRIRRGVTGIRLAAALVGLVATAPALAAQLTLTWIDNASNELGFRIERRLNPSGSYAEITTVGPNVTSYADMGVTAGQGYCYQVRAYNAAGNSGYSNEACGTAAAAPPPDTTPPVLSNGLPTGTLPAGTTQTTLSLTTNEAATCRYGPTAGVAYASLPTAFTTTGGTTHSTPLTGLVNGTSYTRYVRCRDAAANANTTDFPISFAVAQAYTLTVSKTGTGPGTVTSTPSGIACSSGTCTASFTSGAVVSLAPSGGTLTAWGGACSGAGACNVSMSANKTVTATFAPLTFTLTVTKTGTGTVTSTTPANAIACGADCTETVPSGTAITLTATPGTGFTLAGWSGGGCSGTSTTCTVTLTTNTTVTASFALLGPGGSGWRAIVTGAGPGGGPHVRLLDTVTGASLAEFFAYDPAFTGGVHVATGDVTGDGVPDVITAPGPGGGPHVKVFDGAALLTGAVVEVRSFFAYDPSFTGGVFVAAADVNGDGRADLITSPGPGGGPHVRVFDGATGAPLAGPLGSFFAYDPSFTGGVFVAAADLTGDGRADLITGAGPGGGPHVRVFDAVTGASRAEFFAYAPTFTGGVHVAVGDVTGGGVPDVITGAGAGGGPHVKVFDGAALLTGAVVEVRSFFAYDPSFTGGVFVAAADVNGNGRADLITSPGPGGDGPHLKIFDGATGALLASPLGNFFAYPPSFMGGVFVAGFH